MNDDVILSLVDLCARFSSERGDVDALAHVDLSIQRGEFVCFIGPSGCGKSTLLRIIAGLIPPTCGELRLAAQTQVGLVFQSPTLLPWRTVRGNISLPLDLTGTPDPAKVDDLIALVGLQGFEDNLPAELSGGMAQRASLARALAHNPDILLLDEPFGALDALTRETMANELLRIWERDQRTMIMVTHSVEEAVLLADRVIVFSPRPGTVVGEVKIPLQRPRRAALRSSVQVQALAETLRGMLKAR